jgi:hypothetical protein
MFERFSRAPREALEKVKNGDRRLPFVRNPPEHETCVATLFVFPSTRFVVDRTPRTGATVDVALCNTGTGRAVQRGAARTTALPSHDDGVRLLRARGARFQSFFFFSKISSMSPYSLAWPGPM